MGRVLAIWLDGFDVGLADAWGLEALGRLASESAHAELESGGSYLTGLAGEHLSTGLDPTASGRASGVHFDPACLQAFFAAWQEVLQIHVAYRDDSLLHHHRAG